MATCISLKVKLCKITMANLHTPCKLAIVFLHNFTFNEILCKHNGTPLGAHFTYWNSVTYWPEDG